MNKFYECIKNLYTKNDYDWIKYFSDINCISVISAIKSCDISLECLKKVTKYMYVLDNDCLFIYINSIIKKEYKVPWIKYYKKKKDTKVDLLHNRIRKYFNYSEKEYNYIHPTIHNIIHKKIQEYYVKFGVE